MDLLADVLSASQFNSMVYCQTDFTAPWGVKWEGRAGRAGFIMIVRGSCFLECGMSDQPVSMAPGDFLLTSRARPYTLRDSLSSPVTRFDDVLAEVNLDSTTRNRTFSFGGGGAATRVVMGCYDFDTSGNNPFFSSLPEFIYIKAEELQAEPWMEPTLRFLSSELANERFGSSIAVDRLTELVFVQAVRVHVTRTQLSRSHTSGWLKAIGDGQIGKALAAIHANPHEPWTVASLAQHVDMSRSSFAAKFKDLTGSSPLDYVTSWRMHKAQSLLEQGSTSIFDVANLVGYKSEAAFSKAFKRETGRPPGFCRKHGVSDMAALK
jgi:AraC family transcriptional regulator, alkane utilization regulator